MTIVKFYVVVQCSSMISNHTISTISPRYAAQSAALRHFYNQIRTTNNITKYNVETEKHILASYTIRVRFTKENKQISHNYIYTRTGSTSSLFIIT